MENSHHRQTRDRLREVKQELDARFENLATVLEDSNSPDYLDRLNSILFGLATEAYRLRVDTEKASSNVIAEVQQARAEKLGRTRYEYRVLPIDSCGDSLDCWIEDDRGAAIDRAKDYVEQGIAAAAYVERVSIRTEVAVGVWSCGSKEALEAGGWKLDSVREG